MTSTLTVGTPITVDSGSSVEPISLVKLSATLYMVIYAKSTDLYARTLSLSGTTLTANAEQSIDTFDVGNNTWAALTAMSSTAAMCVYVDGTSFDTNAVMLTVSGTTITVNTPTVLTAGTEFGLATIDSTNAILGYDLGGSSVAVVLSVSGTTITENTSAEYEAASTSATKIAVYSSSKALVTWATVPASATEGAIIDISGTTLTANTKKTINARTPDVGDNATTCVAISSTVAIHGHSGATDSYLITLTLNGTTFDLGTELTISSVDYGGMSVAALDSTNFVLIGSVTGGTHQAKWYTASGGTITQVATDTFTGASASWLWAAPVDSTHIVLHFRASSMSGAVASALTSFSGYDLVQSSGGFAKSAIAVSQDGNALFVALEDNATGNQIVFKGTRPSAPTITTAYEPFSGSAANVETTGDSDRMAFFGNFGTDVVVIDHAIAAGTNTDISPASQGADEFQPLKVDPSDINHVVAVNVTDQDAYETEDGGSNWSVLNATLGQTVEAMDVAFFGVLWPFGAFIGGDDAVDENLTYSPNEFANLREDTSAALKAVTKITAVDIAV